MSVKNHSVHLPVMQMRADIGPQSINKDQRTVEIVWSTGKKGLRSTWDGSYYEELSMDPSHVRMERLLSGNTPLLDNHNRGDGNAAVIGVVEKASLENGVGTATVRFADTADVADLWRKVETGILRNISVGYSVYKYERQPQADNEEVPTYLATDWEPTEISVVPVGFDEKSVVRSRDESEKPCVFVNNLPEKISERTEEVISMNVQEQEQKRAVDAELQTKVEQARAQEKTRQQEIRKMVSGVKLSSEFADRMINEDKSIDQAREIVISELARKSDEVQTINANTTVAGGTPSHSEERKVGLENAMLHRADPGIVKLSEAGRHFRGLSLLEMARDCLNASGISTRGMTKMDLASRAFNSSSDFPEVLANVANKSLRKGYDESPRTFLSWAKRAQISDFKQVSRTQLGEAPSLEMIGENGEIKKGTIGEGAEKYSLATYAKIIGITRKVIINDDLQAFTNMPAKFGYAAAGLESDVVYQILTANAALSDNVALFHATHKNLGTTGVPSVNTLGEFRKLMRKQKGVNDLRPLNLVLKYLIGPAALETLFEQLCVLTTQPNADSSTNPFKGKLTPIIEPRLDDSSPTIYFGACDPAQADTVEYAYLEGQEGVYTETRQGFEVDGMEVKARLDFAAKALDFRGLVKNAGA
jgi:Caudovirus prohead serine protease